MYALENDLLKITAHTHGGELRSITGKKTGIGYLWHGDPAHWQYHAPVLFPIVGKVKDGLYQTDGKSYRLPQHGLARVRPFEMTGQTDTAIAFQLTADEGTLAVYPYRFILTITYRLIANKVITEYRVENTDDRDIYFSIGGHPAFMCPMKPGNALNDYYFEFEQDERLERMLLDETGYFTHETVPFMNGERIIPISYDLFKQDAIVIKNPKSASIALKSNRHKEYIRFYYHDFPYLGLWTKEGAPFVCIEPWFGHADYVDFKGVLSEKEGIIMLPQGQSFQTSYAVEICE